MRRALDAVIAALATYPGRRIDLLVGEPCFEPPGVLRAAFARAADEPASGYGPAGGLAELRRVLAAREGGDGRSPDEIVVTHGAKGGLLVLLAALVGPGDEVIHPVPCYPAYPALVRRLGGVPVGVAEIGGFTGWNEAVRGAMGPRTRAVVLSSPSNPTGSVVSDDELAALVGLCRRRGVRLVLDEAYAAFRFDGPAVRRNAPDERRTLVRIGSASKSFAVCGWRIGWIAADAELAGRAAEVQAALLNPPATPPQRALLSLPEVPDTTFDDNRRAVRARLEGLAAALRRSGFNVSSPAGGFYLWVDVRDRVGGPAPDTAGWCARLAAERGVGLWPGEDYGSPGWVRLALPQGEAWQDDLRELERRLSGPLPP